MSNSPPRVLVSGTPLGGCRTSLSAIGLLSNPPVDYRAAFDTRILKGLGREVEMNCGERKFSVRHDFRSNYFVPSLLEAGRAHPLSEYFRATLEFARSANGFLFVLDPRTALQDHAINALKKAQAVWREVGRTPAEVPGVVAVNLRDDGLPRTAPEELLELAESPWRRTVLVNAKAGAGIRELVDALFAEVHA